MSGGIGRTWQRIMRVSPTRGVILLVGAAALAWIVFALLVGHE